MGVVVAIGAAWVHNSNTCWCSIACYTVPIKLAPKMCRREVMVVRLAAGEA